MISRKVVGARGLLAVLAMLGSVGAAHADGCTVEYAKFKKSKSYQAAWAKGPTGCGWADGRTTVKEARAAALRFCAQYSRKCKVTEVKSSRYRDDSKENLCAEALTDGREDWISADASDAPAEAKRRGLSLGDCRMALGLSETIRAASVENAMTDADWTKTFSGMNDAALCRQALTADQSAFDTSSDWARYGMEAQRRGLDVDGCRKAMRSLGKSTTSQATATKLSSEEQVLLAQLGKPELCRSALGPDRRAFRASATFAAHVQEVFRRGMTINDCRRELGLPEITEVATPVLQDPQVLKSASIEDVCANALRGDRQGFDLGGAKVYLEEARFRGLTVNICRKAMRLEPFATSGFDAEAEGTGSLSTEEICAAAFVPRRLGFTSDPATGEIVLEAKKRDLHPAHCETALATFDLLGPQRGPAMRLLRLFDAYAKSGSADPQMLVLTGKAIQLRSAVRESSKERVATGMAELQAALLASPVYSTYLAGREIRRAQEQAVAFDVARAKLLLNQRFITSYVTRNSLLESAPKLFPLIDSAGSAVASKDVARMERTIAEIDGILLREKLVAEREAFIEKTCAGSPLAECAGETSPAVAVEIAKTEVTTSETTPQPFLSGGKRVALVIGNSAYERTTALPNTVNDAVAVSAALRRLGFQVIERANQSKQDMDQSFAAFAREIRDADAALFFYAGHAMQYENANYLMPVDASLESEEDLRYQMAKLDDLMADMRRARGVRIAILDACRDNPLARRLAAQLDPTRSSGLMRGLARVEGSAGSLVAFSTQADDVAADGQGPNSPFTTALLKHIETPDLEVGIMFRRVAKDVNDATAGRQLPELKVSLIGEFYFRAR